MERAKTASSCRARAVIGTAVDYFSSEIGAKSAALDELLQKMTRFIRPDLKIWIGACIRI